MFQWKESEATVLASERLTNYHHGKMGLGKATGGNFKSLAIKRDFETDQINPEQSYLLHLLNM